MSYDFDEHEVSTTVVVRRSLRTRAVAQYWRFILWCALDAPLDFVNQWGLRRVLGKVK